MAWIGLRSSASGSAICDEVVIDGKEGKSVGPLGRDAVLVLSALRLAACTDRAVDGDDEPNEVKGCC